jgi:hypothetical protein
MRSYVIAKATAAAATIRTANAAVNTEIQVATRRKSQSRLALKAPWRGGTIGIAGRRVGDIGRALLGSGGEEAGHDHGEGDSQPDELDGDGEHGAPRARGRGMKLSP